MEKEKKKSGAGKLLLILLGCAAGLGVITVLVIAAIVVLICLGIALALFLQPAGPVEFNGNGYNITLTEEFEVLPSQSYEGRYSSGEVLVRVQQLDAFAYEERQLREHAEGLIEVYNIVPIDYEFEGDRIYFSYMKDDGTGSATNYHMMAVYDTGDAFWLVEFITVGSQSDQYRDDFREWADSVEFD